MAISIGPTIGIEGEKEFRDALRNIIQQCKTLASESDRVSTAFKKNTDAISAFKDQSDALQQQLAKQSQRVEQLYQMYEQCSDIYGELDTRTLKWKQALNQAETEADGIRSKISDLNVELEKDAVTTATKNVESLQAEYDRITTSADNWGNSTTEVEVQQEALSKVIVAQKDKIDALNDLYKTASKQLGRNSDDLIEYETAISKARKELDNLEKSLSEIPKKLAISEFNDAAAKVDGLKQEYDAITNSVGLYKTAAEKATAQQENLSKQIEAQKDKVDALYRVYETCADSLGRTDSETLKWKATLGQAESELTQMENALSRVNLELKKSDLETQGKRVSVVTAEYEKASTALEKHKSALQQNANQHEILGRAVEAQKDKIKVLNDVYYEAQNALDRNEDELLEWRTAILNAETELDNLQWQLKELPSQLQLVGDKCSQIGGTLTSVGTGLTAAVTTPIVALGTKAVTTYGDVDKVFRQVKATIGEDNGTVEEFNHLWDVMMDEATESVYDVQDAADALLNYAQAGFSATECADMLHGAFALAAGTGTEMTTVTSGMSVALKAFNADSSEASHYADVFAKGQAQARVTTTDLMDSLTYAAPVFQNLGYSVEDLVAAVGMMGDAGQTGSEAGAALRTGLMRLAAPTDKASELMIQLGLEASDVSEMFSEEEGSLDDCAAAMEQYGLSSQTIFDAQGNIRPMVEIIENLNSAFSDLSQQEKMDAIDKIFGKNRGSAWLSLIDQGSGKFERLQTALENSEGSADAMANSLMEGVGGALERMSSDIDVFLNTLGKRLGPLAQKVADFVSGCVDWFLQLDEETQTMVATAGLVVAAIGPILLVMGTLLTTFGKVATAITAIDKLAVAFKTGETAAVGLVNAVKMISGIGLIISGVIASVSSFVSMWQSGFSVIKEAIMLVGIALTAVGAIILGAPIAIAAVVAGIVAAVATAVVLIKEHWDSIVDFFVGLWERIQSDVDVAMCKVGEIITSVWISIKDTLGPIIEPIISMMKENWQSFINFMSAILYFLENLIKGVWNIIYAIIDGILYQINKAITFVWNSIVAFMQPKLQFISNLVSTAFNAIKSIVTTVMNAVYNVVNPIWQKISNAFTTRVNAIKTTISNGFNHIKTTISNILGDIWDTLTGFLDDAFTWGKDFVNNLADGIRDAADSVRKACTSIATDIWDFLHFSEPEKGPLSKMHTWMPDMMNQLAEGMLNNRLVVSNAALTVAGDMAGAMTPTGTTNNTNVGGITIVVNGAAGQDVNELADVVMHKINNQFTRNRVAFG